MSRRFRWFLVCLPLLLAAGVSFAVGYQPNFIRNLIGPITVTGNLTASGTVTGADVTATDDLTAGDDLVVTDDMSADVASVASVEFTGGGTPGFERGGNTTVQTRSGDNLAVLGSASGSGSQSTWYVYDALHNPANGAPCLGNAGALTINDPAGVCISDGTNQVAAISAAGAITTTNTKTKDCVALVAGTQTVEVATGVDCTVGSTTANHAYGSVSGTTLTLNGTGTDTVCYTCL